MGTSPTWINNFRERRTRRTRLSGIQRRVYEYRITCFKASRYARPFKTYFTILFALQVRAGFDCPVSSFFVPFSQWTRLRCRERTLSAWRICDPVGVDETVKLRFDCREIAVRARRSSAPPQEATGVPTLVTIILPYTWIRG